MMTVNQCHNQKFTVELDWKWGSLNFNIACKYVTIRTIICLMFCPCSSVAPKLFSSWPVGEIPLQYSRGVSKQRFFLFVFFILRDRVKYNKMCCNQSKLFSFNQQVNLGSVFAETKINRLTSFSTITPPIFVYFRGSIQLWSCRLNLVLFSVLTKISDHERTDCFYKVQK